MAKPRPVQRVEFRVEQCAKLRVAWHGKPSVLKGSV
jgi:hypothetical protein